MHPDQTQPPQLAQELPRIDAEGQGVLPRQNIDLGNTVTEDIGDNEMETSETESLIRISTLAFGLALVLFSLLTIELSIRWNRIAGVNKLISTGQLIPFVIGVGSMFQSCWIAGKRFLEIRKERKAKKKS